MKLYDENKNYVGEIERPGPMVHYKNNHWYEFLEFRPAKHGELVLDYQHLLQGYMGTADSFSFWIASEIPRATPEQLRAIGMRERDGRPVKVKDNDLIWVGGNEVSQTHEGYPSFGRYRFVLVSNVQKEVHTSCEGCVHPNYPSCVRHCVQDNGERKNYIPKQQYLTKDGKPFHCKNCGVYHTDACSTTDEEKSKFPLLSFQCCWVPKYPPQPEDPRFSVEQISEWLRRQFETYHTQEWLLCTKTLIRRITNSKDGLAAFTERRKECP